MSEQEKVPQDGTGGLGGGGKADRQNEGRTEREREGGCEGVKVRD